MKSLVQLYTIALKYWVFLVIGIVFMLLYASFSGVSVMMVIPLFDYVFIPDKAVTIPTLSQFLQAVGDTTSQYLSAHGGFSGMFSTTALKGLWAEIAQLMKQADSMMLLELISIITLSLFFLKSGFFYMNRLMFINLQGKIVRDYRGLMFTNYMRQTIAFFNKNRVGDTLVRMVNDVEIVSNGFVMTVLSMLREIVMVIMYAALAFSLNPKLFLYSMVVLPVFSLTISRLGKKIKKYSKKVQGQFSDMFSAVEEVLNNMKIVKAFCREEYEIGRVNGINNSYFRFWRKARLYSNVHSPLSEFNSALTGVIVVMMGGSMVLNSASGFSFGDFLGFLFAVFSMLHPMNLLANAYTEFKKAKVSLDRVSQILDLEPEIVSPPNPESLGTFNNRIEFRNVSFSYDGTKQVLHDVSLTIPKGKTVALVGSSGSGKTTMVNLLPRFFDVTGGSIHIDGHDIRMLRLADLRSQMGFVTQESILFTETVAGNVRYGSLRQLSDAEVEKACRIAHATEFIEDLPQTYNTLLQPRGSNLSGGQKQRLCIARAIAGDPPILIFDEATSSLDTESEKKVQMAIDEATRNRTVIIIAHRLSTVLKADLIVVMDKGRIIGTGTHQELLKTCDRYKVLYEMQFADTDSLRSTHGTTI